MSRENDLARLGELARLHLDHRLGLMQVATQALDRSKDQLLAITQAARPAADLPLVAAERAELTYQRWADLRRSELNLVIARQTAEWLDVRDQARTAFGRCQALKGLAKTLSERTSRKSVADG